MNKSYIKCFASPSVRVCAVFVLYNTAARQDRQPTATEIIIIIRKVSCLLAVSKCKSSPGQQRTRRRRHRHRCYRFLPANSVGVHQRTCLVVGLLWFNTPGSRCHSSSLASLSLPLLHTKKQQLHVT